VASTGIGTSPLQSTFFKAWHFTPNSASVVPAILSLYFFGQTVETLAGIADGSSDAQATIERSWWANAQNGWTLNASTRAAVVGTPATANFAVRATIPDAAPGISIMLRAADDGRAGFEVAILKGADIDPAATAGENYVVVRRVFESQPIEEATDIYAVPNGASDTPANVPAYVNVESTIPDGVQFTIDARIANGFVEVRLNEDSATIIRHEILDDYTPVADIETFAPSAAEGFPNHTKAGFASSTSGARIITAAIVSLDGERSSRADILLAVAGGNLYVLQDEDVGVQQVASGLFPVDRDVMMAEFNGRMLMVGGGKAYKYDPVTVSVSKYIPSSGTLPGQTTPGTTTANGVMTYLSRVAFFLIDGDEQNIVFTANDDEDDLNLTSDLSGSAFALAGFRVNRIGQPITCVQQASTSAMVIGCNANIYILLGDPALGQIQSIPKSLDTGISGPQSMWLAMEGRVIAHSPLGLLVVSQGGDVGNLTAPILTEGIQTTALDTPPRVIVIRDAARHGVHVFMTKAGDAGSTHFWYDERIGGWEPGRGGFFPEHYPLNCQPSAACIWKAQVIIGTEAGFLVRFKDTARDDLDQPIESFATMTRLAFGDENDEAIIRRMQLVFSVASAPVQLTVYKGDTSEIVYDTTKRREMLSMTLEVPKPSPLTQTIRGPSLIVVLSDVEGGAWRLEMITCDVTAGPDRSGRV